MSAPATLAFDLAPRLVECGLGQQSGIVTATRGKLKRAFCVDRGFLTWATSNVIEEQIGERLVTRGLLTPEALATVRARAAEVGGVLSRRLVDDEVLDLATLGQAVEQNVRDLLSSTLEWADGEVRLDHGTPNLAGEVTVRLDCARLLLDYAMQRPKTLPEVRARIGLPVTRLIVQATHRELLGGLEHDPAVAHLVRRAEGGCAVVDLVQESPAAEEPTWRTLWGLILAGILAPAARSSLAGEAFTREEILARFARVEGADHYTVLDLSALATREQVREAYYVLARRMHPDRFRAGALADLRPRVETYFTRVTEAYNTLYDPLMRGEYDAQRAAIMTTPATVVATQSTETLARQNHLRAKDMIRRGRYAEAVTCLENAVKLSPRNAGYHIDLGRLTADNPRLRDKAEGHLLEATQLDPTRIDAYLVLGDLYIKSKRRSSAAKMFSEVLRWEPAHAEAKSKLAGLQEKE